MRHFFCDSLKRFLMVFVATLAFVAPTFAANLPSGYTELEYIQSTGTQYIDTGVTPAQITKMESKAQFSRVDVRQALLSVNNNGSAPWDTFVGVNPASSLNKFFSQWGANTVSPSTWQVATDTNLHTFIFDKKAPTFTVDNTTVTIVDYTMSEASGNMYMFAMNAGTQGVDRLAYAKIYYMKLYENGTLIRDFVPAKNSSGVIGVYDMVSGTFFTNQGTGTFIAGPTACNGTRVNYTTATGTVTQSGTPTPTNPITPTFYTQGDLVLRKVGDYADSYDATTGKITRRVGVKVLDGTENWVYDTSSGGRLDSMYNLVINDMFAEASSVTSNRQSPYSTHFARSTNWISNSAETRLNKIQAYTSSAGTPILGLGYQDVSSANIPTFKSWLAAQHAAGTPVIVYYPLKTAVVEDWPAEQCVAGTGIKIATTKYTEDAFAGLMTTLSEAITKVTNIVDTTVQQATEIGNLATTKQDRPDTDCPAGRKCLLIMGADNKPHWYLIQE